MREALYEAEIRLEIEFSGVLILKSLGSVASALPSLPLSLVTKAINHKAEKPLGPSGFEQSLV
jgi:hypothetical protein